MSPRVLKDVIVFGCAAAGALLGYSAGAAHDAPVQLCLSFLGLSLGGAFSEMCIMRR